MGSEMCIRDRHRVRGEGRGGQRWAALAPARPASPCVGPAQRQRSFATIPRRSRAMVATPSPSSALSSARRRCARLRRERARPSRRGFECSARTASAVASRAPRRTSRPRHGPGPARQPTGPLVHLLHQGRAALARRDEAVGRRSDAARGARTRTASAPRRPGPRGRPGAPPRGATWSAVKDLGVREALACGSPQFLASTIPSYRQPNLNSWERRLQFL